MACSEVVAGWVRIELQTKVESYRRAIRGGLTYSPTRLDQFREAHYVYSELLSLFNKAHADGQL